MGCPVRRGRASRCSKYGMSLYHDQAQCKQHICDASERMIWEMIISNCITPHIVSRCNSSLAYAPEMGHIDLGQGVSGVP
jgi:hypothetical protein